MSTRQTVDKIYEDRRAGDAALDAARYRCDHSRYRVGWYSWRLGAMAPARLCLDCDTHLGRPEQVEVNEFMAAEKARQRKFLIEAYGEAAALSMLAALPDSDCWTKPIG
jgi:hypothetical protein